MRVSGRKVLLKFKQNPWNVYDKANFYLSCNFAGK